MLEFRFDTQLLIEGHGLDEDAIHDYILANIAGDCLLAVGDEDLIKIHFHTNTPWKVLEYCAGLLCGERSPIRYGRKNTLLFPSISSVMGFCSSEYSFVFIISSIHHLLHEAALSIHPIR